MGASLTMMSLVAGGLSAVSSFVGAEQQRRQQKAQASALASQADMTRRQADIAKQKGRVEAENIDRQKSALRRDFEAMQGHNRSLLAAGNVDMGSGSALDVSLGNIDRFAGDMGENAYQRALKEWETSENVNALHYQADSYDAQSSYLRKTAGNFMTSLLTSSLNGLAAGVGASGSAGYTLGAENPGVGSGAGAGAAGGNLGTPPKLDNLKLW